MSLPDFPLHSPRSLVIADPKEKERLSDQLYMGILNWEVVHLSGGDACARQKPEGWSQAETALMLSPGVLLLMVNYKPQSSFNIYLLS